MKYHSVIDKVIMGILVVLGILSIIATGPGSDPDEKNNPLQTPITDITGTWNVQKVVEGNCEGEIYPKLEIDIMTVSQIGNDLIITDTSTGNISEGTISGNQITWTTEYSDDDSTTSINFSGTVSENGGSITGSGTWVWTNGINTCSGTADVNASKVSQPDVNVTGRWIGDWQSSFGDLSGPFTVNIVQQDSIMSGSIDVPYIELSNANLKGTIEGSKITFGDINDIITFNGAVFGDLTSSGFYLIPGLGDKGSWQARKYDSLNVMSSFDLQNTYSRGLAYDGTYLWFADDFENKIFKIDTSGNISASFDFPCGGVGDFAYDGTNLWMTDNGDNKIYKISPPTLEISHTCLSYVCGFEKSKTEDLAFDGEYLWRIGIDSWDKKIYKLDTSGNVIDSFYFENCSPTGLTYDGSDLWFTDDYENKIFKIDTSGTIISSFDSPGTNPQGLAYDGTNLWLADSGEDKMYKIDPSRNIDSFDSPCTHPYRLTFDGTFLYLANYYNKNIYQVDTSGQVIAVYSSPCIDPSGITYDGTDLWIAGGGYPNYKIYKMNTPKYIVTSFESPCGLPQDLAYDGQYLWIIGDWDNKIFKMDTSGNILSSFSISAYNSPYGLAYDGTYLLIATFGGKIYKAEEADTSLNIFEFFDSPCTYPKGFAYDGACLWLADDQDDKIYKIDTSGTIVASFDSPCTDSEGLAYDGTYLWLAENSNDDSEDKIYKIDTSGTIIASFESPEPNPTGLAYDGNYLWSVVGETYEKRICRINTNEMLQERVISSFDSLRGPMESEPLALTTDGAFLWVLNGSEQKFYKLDFSGNVMDSFDFPVDDGFAAGGLTYDGEYLWFNDALHNIIYKIDTSGEIIGSFDAPPSSHAQLHGSLSGLAYDGTFFWGAGLNEDILYKIDTSGNVIDSFDSPVGYPRNIAYDGEYLWIAYEYDSTWDGCQFYKIDTDRNSIGFFYYPGDGKIIEGFTADGTYLWVSFKDDEKIYKITPPDNLIDSIDSPGDCPAGLTFDGTCLWVSDADTDTIHRIETDGNVLGSFDIPDVLYGGLAYDGDYLWLAGSFHKIYKVDTSGNIVEYIYSPSRYPAGLTYDGTYLWLNWDKIYQLELNN